MLKTIIRTTACLAVSTAALVAVTKLDATAGDRRSRSNPESTTPKPAPSKPAPPAPAPAPPAPKLTLTTIALPPPPVPSTAADTVKVPNWKGKRLSVAFRDARKLGITVTALDDRGDEVKTGEVLPMMPASDFRVRRMLTAAGTAVEPGAVVQVRVREIVEPAEGY